jgi:hypothetical protein
VLACPALCWWDYPTQPSTSRVIVVLLTGLVRARSRAARARRVRVGVADHRAPVAGPCDMGCEEILGTGAVECCVAEVGLSPKKNSACRPRGRGHSGLDTAWQVQ